MSAASLQTFATVSYTHLGERINDRGEHTHTVARHTIQPFGRACHPAKYVATAHDDSHLDTHIADLDDLRGVVMKACRVDALLGASR